MTKDEATRIVDQLLILELTAAQLTAARVAGVTVLGGREAAAESDRLKNEARERPWKILAKIRGTDELDYRARMIAMLEDDNGAMLGALRSAERTYREQIGREAA